MGVEESEQLVAKRLTPEYEELKERWESYHQEWGCRCWYVQAPCSSCLHEGNPINLEETPEAWEEYFELDEAVEAAKTLLAAELQIACITAQSYIWAGFKEARYKLGVPVC